MNLCAGVIVFGVLSIHTQFCHAFLQLDLVDSFEIPSVREVERRGRLRNITAEAETYYHGLGDLTRKSVMEWIAGAGFRMLVVQTTLRTNGHRFLCATKLVLRSVMPK